MLKRLFPVFALAWVGCEGSFLSPGLPPPPAPAQTPDGPLPTPVPQSACTAAPTPGTAPVRRLAHEEYVHAVEDLFGDAALAKQVSAGFLTDSVSLGFNNGARFLDVKPVMLQKYQEAAETVAAQVTSAANLPKLVSCQASQGEACARESISKLLLKAFRRPPTDDDLDRYLIVWRLGAAAADLRTGMEWVVGAVLQAPKFLYRFELDVDSPAQRALLPYELASRLSFLLWQAGPDDALFEAARTGRLATPQDVEREARRMLEDPKAERVFNFFEQWMDIDELPSMKRDATTFPGLPPTLSALLREEARQLVKAAVLDGDGKFETLMTTPVTSVNAELARHYGLSGVTGTAWQRVTFPSGRRGGLFMGTGALVSHDKQSRTSIVNRGLRVRTALLCQTVPSPPDNVPLNLAPITGEFSQADRLAQHRNDPSCSGCHALLDPLGVPFEHLDAVGRERTQDEGGRPIDTAGEVTGTRDANGSVADGLALLQKLSRSDEVRQCLVTQLFRFSHGRQEEAADRCSRERALARFKGTDWNVRELLVAMTQTDDFLFKPGATP